MGVTEQKKVRKGKVKRERIFTVYVDTGERYAPTEKFPEGRKKYKRVVRTLGSVHKVSKTRAQIPPSAQPPQSTQAPQPTRQPTATEAQVQSAIAKAKAAGESDEYIRKMIESRGFKPEDFGFKIPEAGIVEKIKKARALGKTDKQIREALITDGYDPRDYGFAP